MGDVTQTVRYLDIKNLAEQPLILAVLIFFLLFLKLSDWLS
jgi:hypothetical protein